MKLITPRTVEEAATLLAATRGARCLSGGQSLVAMMNARLVTPEALISLRDVPELSGITEVESGGWRIGAMTPHAEVARAAAKAAGPDLLRRTAGRIAHPAIRNQGTIGGSLAHADPAADYPVAVACSGADLVLAGPGGRRTVSTRDFFRGYYETALAPDEIIVAVEVPAGPAGAAAHYEKFSLVDGDFALISVAVLLAVEDGRCTAAQIALGACAPAPLRLDAAEAALIGTALSDADLAKAGALLAEAADPIDDFRGSATYRRRLIPRMVARAVRAAQSRLTGHG